MITWPKILKYACVKCRRISINVSPNHGFLFYISYSIYIASIYFECKTFIISITSDVYFCMSHWLGNPLQNLDIRDSTIRRLCWFDDFVFLLTYINPEKCHFGFNFIIRKPEARVDFLILFFMSTKNPQVVFFHDCTSCVYH